jgi:hypothetical protein
MAGVFLPTNASFLGTKTESTETPCQALENKYMKATANVYFRTCVIFLLDLQVDLLDLYDLVLNDYRCKIHVNIENSH